MRKFIDLDVEMAVLNMILSAGDLLSTPDALAYLQRELRGVPGDLLGDPTHQRIDGAARALLNQGRLPLVADLRLQPDLRDVPDAVWAAIDAAPPGAQLGVHVERLTALATDRRLERTLRQSLAHLQASGDAAAVLDELQANLAAARTGTRPPLRGVDMFASVLDYAEARRDGPDDGHPERG